jgi:hypothetical protein
MLLQLAAFLVLLLALLAGTLASKQMTHASELSCYEAVGNLTLIVMLEQ